MKCLAILLFHEEEDLIEDQIKYYKDTNKHDLVVFIHDCTQEVMEKIHKYKEKFICVYELSKEINFRNNEVHNTIYKILRGERIKKQKYIKKNNNIIINFKEYEWISFPEADEFLEGPNREKNFYEHLCHINEEKSIDVINYITYTYWYTEKDDSKIKSPVDRLKYYSINNPGSISENGNSDYKIYTWRGNNTKLRSFGHHINTEETKISWKTRHYEIRSEHQFKVKILDRIKISNGGKNHHYKILYDNYQKLVNFIKSEELFYDNGKQELNNSEKYNWNKIYHY